MKKKEEKQSKREKGWMGTTNRKLGKKLRKRVAFGEEKRGKVGHRKVRKILFLRGRGRERDDYRIKQRQYKGKRKRKGWKL